MRRAAPIVCLALALLGAAASSASADARLVEHPLRPPDTSSPRATLRSFVTNLEQAFVNAADASASSRPALDRAVRCLDLSEIPPELRGDVGLESALLLKEILDRVEVPPFEAVPERLEGAGSWLVPDTPIAIRRVAEGERAGEYLFSPQTVARARELYRRIRDYPYREGATPGLYVAYLTTPGGGLERGWSDHLPEWSQRVLAEQTVWQWIALLVTLIVLGLALTPAIRLARAPQRTGNEEGIPRPTMRPRLVLAVAVGAVAVAGADYVVDEVVNLTGETLVVVTYGLALLRYVFVGWLGALLVRHATELVIRARGLDANAAGTALLRLASWVVVGFIVVGLLVSAGQDFGLPVYSIVTGLGVGGIAIGFGAQSLVRDVLSGVFFLVDDAFRMGEYIDVGSAKGRVERISIRSLQLRHHRGAIHTVPFGEIKTLTNYSRDWVIMKLPMRLTYDTDPQQVKKIVKAISAEMAEDPLLGPSLIEPPKSQGVLQMDDSAMILRVKFMAKPGEQFVLRRELLHRIRAAFEREGIRFASREVTVHVSGEAEDAAKTEAAAGAARRLLDDQPAR